jgi:hypothetical protein
MTEILPVGLASASVANQLSILASYKEKLCRPYCVISSIQPQVNITYSVGTMRLQGTTVFVPITAVIDIITETCPCNAKAHLYTENFYVAFQGRTTLPASVNVTSVGRVGVPTCIKCGKAHSYTLNDSLVISIAGTSSATSTSTDDNETSN